MSKNKRKFKLYPIVKRMFDFTLSLVALIIASPILILVCLLSFVILKGNPIFAQNRPGQNNKIFKMYKFRSMTNKKDKEGNLLPDDMRRTKWGSLLRKTGIDELPQLLNILKGDMSIIGPRPRLVKDVIFYDKHVLAANSVKPGLTGPAQVYDPGSCQSWEKVFNRDIEYANTLSFKTDFKLFVGTITVMLKGKPEGGATQDVEKREYYYADHLLKNNLISKAQYEMGIKEAENMKPKQVIKYMEELHITEKETVIS